MFKKKDRSVKKLREKSGWFMVLKGVGIVAGAGVIAVVSYVLYVVFDYNRIPDVQALKINKIMATQSEESLLQTEETYRMVSYNIGFGAYTPSFSFFMDGGKYSRAVSKNECEATILAACEEMKTLDADFYLVQEVDIDSTRSYHINEVEEIVSKMSGFDWTVIENYHSAYLCIPLQEPHGESNAGMMFLSNRSISKGVRRSLPVQTGIKKFYDLDRCFGQITIPLENGKNLQVFEIHLSAYGIGDEIRQAQRDQLFAEMQKSFQQGDYVICGGDFNHDLNLSEEERGIAEWAQPFPRSELPDGFSFVMDLCEEEDDSAFYSARNADTAYEEGVTGEFALDGFIISDNVEMIEYFVDRTGYQYSDHEPVVMDFKLLDN